MRRIYLVIAVLGVLLFAISELGAGIGFVDRYGPNLAAETLSVLLTLAFVQTIITRQERLKQLRASIPSLRSANAGLAMMAEAWAVVMKGLVREGTPPARSLDELFPSYVTERLVELDIEVTGSVTGGAAGDSDWLAWLVERVRLARERLDDGLTPTLGLVDVEYQELLDALVHDPFLDLLEGLARRRPSARSWRVRLQTAGGHRESFFERLQEAIAAHNRLASEVGRIRGKHAAPRHSLSGLELSSDTDLRVHTELETGWWRRPPLPGSLTARRPGAANGSTDASGAA